MCSEGGDTGRCGGDTERWPWTTPPRFGGHWGVTPPAVGSLGGWRWGGAGGGPTRGSGTPVVCKGGGHEVWRGPPTHATPPFPPPSPRRGSHLGARDRLHPRAGSGRGGRGGGRAALGHRLAGPQRALCVWGEKGRKAGQSRCNPPPPPPRAGDGVRPPPPPNSGGLTRHGDDDVLLGGGRGGGGGRRGGRGGGGAPRQLRPERGGGGGGRGRRRRLLLLRSRRRQLRDVGLRCHGDGGAWSGGGGGNNGEEKRKISGGGEGEAGQGRHRAAA